MMKPSVATFPAVLIAGPPHSGKSVLAYLLSQHLRQDGIAHYLLRAAPDGEGDWFLHNYRSPSVRVVRQENKGAFSERFVWETLGAVRNRMVPLLVDIGGRPQGEQLAIVQACTHVILLYKKLEERKAWEALFSEFNLTRLADLRSVTEGAERLETLAPVLCGTISGLRREEPAPGPVFGVLLERLRGLFAYDEASLAYLHLQKAPATAVREDVLAQELDLWDGQGALRWRAETALPRIAAWQPPSGGMALYGRGPVWLASALALRNAPSPCWMFDVRYGWLALPQVTHRATPALTWQTQPQGDFLVLKARLPHQWLTPADLWLPGDLPQQVPLVLDGRLPRWAMAALVRALAPDRDWLAVRDLHDGGAVLLTGPAAGSRLPLSW